MSGHGEGVLVVGSVNQDVTVLAPRLPSPGETLLGHSVAYGLGGKGANQAVAVARSGVPARLLASVGGDPAGEHLRMALSAYDVDVSLVRTVPSRTTGTALITVDADGENSIVVVPGANAATTPDLVHEIADTISGSAVVVLQSEIPASSVIAVLELLRRSRAHVVVNLAPVIPVPVGALSRADVLVVNETEAGQVLGMPPPAAIDEARTAARRLTDIAGAAVVTLGSAGAVVAERGDPPFHLPAPPPAKVVDTTGAGDAFVGVLAAGLATGADVRAAALAATHAATLTVQGIGAAPSYPRFDLPRRLL